MWRLLVLMLFLAAPACADEAARMNELAARTTLVARAVHFTVRSSTVPAELTGEDLIERATRLNPSMLDDFRDYTITAQRDGLVSSVLVCDKKAQVALIEDAGCTQEVERHSWQARPRLPCDFTLDLGAVCR
ncbi:MAG: hypothetical protein HYU59_15460 [Magnetospirillum gryphiswaldense]|nr:hypothetical protein [Magnetospirillum gryphiswaldense]